MKIVASGQYRLMLLREASIFVETTNHFLIKGLVVGSAMQSKMPVFMIKYLNKSPGDLIFGAFIYQIKNYFLAYLKSLPMNLAESPNSSSIRNNWLYFAILSEREAEPVLI